MFLQNLITPPPAASRNQDGWEGSVGSTLVTQARDRVQIPSPKAGWMRQPTVIPAHRAVDRPIWTARGLTFPGLLLGSGSAALTADNQVQSDQGAVALSTSGDANGTDRQCSHSMTHTLGYSPQAQRKQPSSLSLSRGENGEQPRNPGQVTRCLLCGPFI